jgi:hypothetical protein
MTSALAEKPPWPLRRWGAMIALIFGGQLGLIFWLGSTEPLRPRLTTAALDLQLAGQASAELQALNDPTLFILPHPQGFSGPVWLRIQTPVFRSFEWSAPDNQLVLPLDQLGAAFNPLVEKSDFTGLQLPAQAEPALTLPDLPPLAGLAVRSVLELEGGLAQRRLLTPLELKSWSHPDILASSVVQVIVDAEGRPVSPPTLLSISGSAEADQAALKLARTARFEPVGCNQADGAPNPTAQLSWGKMIFRWHTVPMPPASTPAVNR